MSPRVHPVERPAGTWLAQTPPGSAEPPPDVLAFEATARQNYANKLRRCSIDEPYMPGCRIPTSMTCFGSRTRTVELRARTNERSSTAAARFRRPKYRRRRSATTRSRLSGVGSGPSRFPNGAPRGMASFATSPPRASATSSVLRISGFASPTF